MFILEYGTFFPVSQFCSKMGFYIHQLLLIRLQNQNLGDYLPILSCSLNNRFNFICHRLQQGDFLI